MKNIFLYVGITAAVLLSSCNKDESSLPLPTPLNSETVKAEERPGAILFKWDIPEDADYYCVSVNYKLPDQDKLYTRMASIYSDTLLIDGLLKRYGELDFTFQTFNKDMKGGEKFTIKAQSGAALKTITLTGEEESIALTQEQVFTDNIDPTTSIADMLDGNVSTAFVSDWAAPGPMPRYIVMDLKKEVQAFGFSYTTRQHSNKDHPKVINVYASKTFDGAFDPSKATLITTIKSGLPEGSAETYNSPSLIIDGDPCSVIWLEIMETVSNNLWVSLSEISVKEYKTSIIDPEAND